MYPGSWIDFKIIIFSKWGGVVYESDNPEEGWDGTINNKKNDISGIYTYYIEVKIYIMRFINMKVLLV